MPNLLTDTRAGAIVENVRTVIAAIARRGEEPVFQGVGVYDDLESFLKVCDGLKGVTAAVIVSPPEQARGGDNEQDEIVRMNLRVAVCAAFVRPPGGEESIEVAKINELAGLIRTALQTDRTRGGKADLINFGGMMIAGTELSGPVRLENRQPNQAFNVFTVPVTCGWTV